MGKMFEVSHYSQIYGMFAAEDNVAAMEAQARDASYAGIDDMIEQTGQTLENYWANTRAIEVEIKGISLDTWEEEKVAIYFNLYLNGDKTRSLEWVNEDGDLEVSDSHIVYAHSFSEPLTDYIREKLNEYLAVHRDEAIELHKDLSPQTEEFDD